MDKFNLDINNVDQKKIRKVNNMPIDESSIALAWFNSKPVTPANNISITDLSNFIPENSYSSDINAINLSAKNKLVFTNELGVLEDSDGNTVFDSDDISISDVFLNEKTFDKKYFISDINKNNFVHSFYVSRYYTLLPRDSYSYSGLDDFLPELNYPKSIKIIDENGFEYINQDTGFKRYRILIEQLNLPIYSNRSTLPSKIIVLFDSPSPTDLFLVYDKVVLSSNESITSVVPQYKENINTVSIFKRVSEESIVVDNSSRFKKVYNKKALTAKQNLINSTNTKAEGFEIFVPKKALADNRTYESFNWRSIAKVKRSVDSSTINNGEEIDLEGNIKQKVVNAAILATSAQIAIMEQSQNFNAVSPYSILRLEQSPFNISRYTFLNPLSETANVYKRNQARYWLLDVDNVTDEQLALYDILLWTPSSPITIAQGQKIKKYVELTQGTLVLDLSNTSFGAETIDPSLSISTTEYVLDSWSYNSENIFLNENKNNSWPLNQSVFERLTVDNVDYDVYSLFGRSNLSDLTTKKTVKEFTGSLSSNNIILKNSRNKPIFINLQFTPEVDALVRGNILATTTPMLKYCNDIYQPSSVFDIASNNSGPENLNETTFNVVASIEGPMKLLYNSVSISLLSRIFSTKIKDIRSSMYYQVSDWQSSYVLNGQVLLEDEKKENYSLLRIDSTSAVGVSRYAKKITPTNTSLLDFYRKSVYDFLTDQHSISLQEIDINNLEFYIEVTNNDVNIVNGTLVKGRGLTYSVENEIPTSYSLFAIANSFITQPLYAYTDSPSAEFVVPGGFGAYVIREKLYRSSNEQINDSISNVISSSNVYKNYSFNFSIFNSYNQSIESPVVFDVNWSAVMIAEYTGYLSRLKKVIDVYTTDSEIIKEAIPETNSTTRQNIPATITLESEEAFSGADRIRDTNASSRQNNFLYTGDIQNGNIFGAYGVGKSGMLADYIDYIQISMREANILVAGKAPVLTGKYESNTKTAVTNFQKATNARFEDGTVDSETKSLIAYKVWKAIKTTDPVRYNAILDRITVQKPNVKKFIVAAAEAIELENLYNTIWNYRKITFSGQEGPILCRDKIYYKVPFSKIPEGLESHVLKSVTIHPGKEWARSKSYKGISLISANVYSGIDEQGPQRVKGKLDYTTQPIKIDINKPMSECMFFAFDIEGSKLGGDFGPYAEGYSINKVEFEITYTINKDTIMNTPGTAATIKEATRREVIRYESETTTAMVRVEFTVTGSATGISPNKAEIIDLNGVNSTKYAANVTSIIYPTWSGEKTLTFTANEKLDFSDTAYNPPFTRYSDQETEPSYKDENIYVDLTKPIAFSIKPNTLQVSNVLSGTKNPISSSAISMSVSSNRLIFQTSSLIYQNSNIIKSNEVLLENYWLLKSDGSIIKSNKNSISTLDGLVLLVQPSLDPDKIAKPFGLSLGTFAKTLSSDQEINLDYGSFILNNNTRNNDGLLWGFYDKNKKEFLGTNLYYVDWISRGPENVYIGALAIDADGNLGNGIDFFGPKTTGKIIPNKVPVKIACPIYNVQYIPSSRIGISSIPPNISKLQQWPLYITSGSFVKDIYIDPAYGWTSWAKKYTGKTLRATYSTLKMDNAIWSPIAGKPYIKIINETPVVISSKRYQLIQVPIATFVEPTQMQCGAVLNWIQFQSRKTIYDPWVDVNSNIIRNINCQTGIVDLVKPITDNQDLIRVSYTAKSTGIPIKHVDGRVLPLNPFLNRDIVEPEKALHIFTKPIRIETISSNQGAYVWDYVGDYSYGEPIDFTYDTSIFDPYNSTKYDPFALQIGLIHVLNSVNIKDLSIQDLRVKGGGLKATMGKTIDVKSYGSLDINKVFQDIKEASSFWDVYPPDQHAYSKGGFIIIKMPKEVLNNFTNEFELYSIIRRNITAGVVFKLQDMEGNDWGVFE